jgi:hypothetical protein
MIFGTVEVARYISFAWNAESARKNMQCKRFRICRRLTVLITTIFLDVTSVEQL